MTIIPGFIRKAIDRQLQRYRSYLTGNAAILGAHAIYPDSEIETLIEEAFNKNIYYYSIIRTVCRKFASPPRYVMLPKKERKALRTKADEMIDNDLSKLLNKPNDYQGADEFWESIMGYYSLTGEVFIWKNRGGFENKPPMELIVVPPQIVEIQPDPQDVWGVLHYWFNLNGVRVEIEKRDIIHWKTFNPNFDASTREHLRGFNPLSAQKRTVTQANDGIDAQVAQMQNGGAKGALYEEGLGSLDEGQEAQLRKTINDKFNSKHVKGAIATLQGKWGYLNLGMSSTDMQLLDATDRAVHALCMANGIPTEIFFPDATHANKEQAMIYYITNTLMPIAQSLDSKLNAELVPEFGGGMYIMTDFSDLPELAYLNARLVDAAAKAWWKTVDEKRAMTGDEPLGTPASQMIFIQQNFIPLDDAAVSIPPGEDLRMPAKGDYYQ